MNYRASVVIPLLRQADEWLEVSVQSALTQSVRTEVIVVRSEMTPQSNLAVLKRLQRHHEDLSVLTERKAGNFANAINVGFQAARADRVGLLLSDDWLSQNAVFECVEQTADIVSTGNVVYFPDGRINEAACRTPILAQFQSLPTLEAKAIYLTHFFLFKRAIIGVGLDETIGNLAGVDDFDLIWTLLEQQATVAVVEKPLYHYRDHDGERLTLSNPQESIRCLEKILTKHGIEGEAATERIRRHSRWYGKPIYKVMNLG